MPIWGHPVQGSSYANAYTSTGSSTGTFLDAETGLYYYRHRVYHSQLGRFASRDPVGYRGGINQYVYVSGRPLTFPDPLGLVLLAVEPVIVGTMSIVEVLYGRGTANLGRMELDARWYTNGPITHILYTFDSPICESCRVYVASCTYERVIIGTARIKIRRVVLGDAPQPMARYANEFNAMVDWEERAHQNSALRWLRDHDKTGYGVGCTEQTAKDSACAMAAALVRVHEAVIVAAWNAENFIIDLMGDAWWGSIRQRGREEAERLLGQGP